MAHDLTADDIDVERLHRLYISGADDNVVDRFQIKRRIAGHVLLPVVAVLEVCPGHSHLTTEAVGQTTSDIAFRSSPSYQMSLVSLAYRKPSGTALPPPSRYRVTSTSRKAGRIT